MNRRFVHLEHSIGGVTHVAGTTHGRRRLRRWVASGNDARDRRTNAIGDYPATEAERRAHCLRSLRGIVAALVVFYATVALVIALIMAVWSY